MNNNFSINIKPCGILPHYLITEQTVNLIGNIDLSEIEVMAVALAVKKYNDIEDNFEITDFLASQGKSLDGYFSRISISQDENFIKEILVNNEGNIIERPEDIKHFKAL